MTGRGASVTGGLDVTVVIAVYNTMPYLTKCLTSVVGQSIGRHRMEVIAVDDGSTDGSGVELDRFAALYPEMFRVIHQANSGGPAGPSNRALEQATGRYVFFLGADDYLGREALARLVAAADEYGSDVTLGKLVGVNGRYVHPVIFERNAESVRLADSSLAWSMSNTKLFRRELIERHGIRFPENMPMLSDQPFTIEACVRAKRISVLADYPFYYAVRRLDASNITFRPRHEELLRCTTRLMDFVAELMGPGKQRNALVLRHFSWEVAKVLRRDFLKLERPVQERLHAGVRRLAKAYLTDAVAKKMAANLRVLFRTAQHGSLDDVLALVRYGVEHTDPPLVAEGDRWYAAYPGFRDAKRGMPDSWFDITDVAANWLARLEATEVEWGRDAFGVRTLNVGVHSPIVDLADRCTEPVTLSVGGVRGTAKVTLTDTGGTSLRVPLSVGELVAAAPEGGARHVVRAHLNLLGSTGVGAVRAQRLKSSARMVYRYGARLYVLTATRNHNGRLIVAITPVTLRRVIGRLSSSRPQGGKRK